MVEKATGNNNNKPTIPIIQNNKPAYEWRLAANHHIPAPRLAVLPVRIGKQIVTRLYVFEATAGGCAYKVLLRLYAAT